MTIRVTSDAVFFTRTTGGVFRLNSEKRAVLISDAEIDAFSALGKKYFGIDLKDGGETTKVLRIERDAIGSYFHYESFPSWDRWFAILDVDLFELIYESKSDIRPPWVEDDSSDDRPPRVD
jgi:hypothetical protein